MHIGNREFVWEWHLIKNDGFNDREAQLVRASHRYRKVTGSNPVEVLNFSGFLYAIAKIAFITAKIIASLNDGFDANEAGTSLTSAILFWREAVHKNFKTELSNRLLLSRT